MGLIITEITRVNDITGAASFGQLGLSHDYQIEPLRRMVDEIHSYGAKIMVELHHPGRQNLGLMIGTVPLSVACDKIMGNAYSKLLTGAIIPPGKNFRIRTLFRERLRRRSAKNQKWLKASTEHSLSTVLKTCTSVR